MLLLLYWFSLTNAQLLLKAFTPAQYSGSWVNEKYWSRSIFYLPEIILGRVRINHRVGYERVKLGVNRLSAKRPRVRQTKQRVCRSFIYVYKRPKLSKRYISSLSCFWSDMLRPVALVLLLEMIKLTCIRVLVSYNEYFTFIRCNVWMKHHFEQVYLRNQPSQTQK